MPNKEQGKLFQQPDYYSDIEMNSALVDTHAQAMGSYSDGTVDNLVEKGNTVTHRKKNKNG